MARPALAAIHKDITERFAKGMGKFSSFLGHWIKHQNNSDLLHAAIGDNGENYLQYRLSRNDVIEALVVLEVGKAHWEAKEQPDRVFAFLNHEDAEGNGIWHYLADSLRQNEGPETMRIARILLALDVDFSKRNRQGVSPLGKMLVPSPKWRSLNALVATKHLSITNVEAAIGEHAKDDQKRAGMMSAIFSSDLSDNRGLLSQHVLKQAVDSQADKKQRAATCRLFFEYVDPRDGATAFFKLIAVTNQGMFEDLLRLLMMNVDETVGAMAPPDVATKKVYRQAVLCKKLLRRDGRRQGVLFKALFAGKHSHLRTIMSLLKNDEIAIKKLVRGEPVRQPVPVEKDSPAPCNPLMSLLLQKDGAGNTVYHHAAFRNDIVALEGFFHNLPSNDIYAILTKVPNGCGLTLADLRDADTAKAKLARAAKAQVVTGPQAQEMLKTVQGIGESIVGYVSRKMEEIEDLAADTRAGAPLAPNFDLTVSGRTSAAPSADRSVA